MVKGTSELNSESQDLLNLIHIICGCVYNVVKGNVPRLTQEKVNKLAHHKTSLIKLTKKVPIKEKRKILI